MLSKSQKQQLKALVSTIIDINEFALRAAKEDARHYYAEADKTQPIETYHAFTKLNETRNNIRNFKRSIKVLSAISRELKK